MRADLYLFNFGYAKSRQNAKIMIESASVSIDGRIVSKPSIEVDEGITHQVDILNKQRFVSRGGEKLDHALSIFDIDVRGFDCIDIGASTGGFTDCLLQRGASTVFAIDSGHSQLDALIEADDRVVSIEKFNARFMEADDFPFLFDVAVMDVSFISQTLIHQSINKILKDGAVFVSLIKPQFECGKAALNSKGIVKKASHHAQAVSKVIDSAFICGFSCIDLIRSPIDGGSGNIEYLAFFKKSQCPVNTITEKNIKNITNSN